MRTRIFTRYVSFRLQKKRAGAWIPLQACQCPLVFREPPIATPHPRGGWPEKLQSGTTSLCRDLYLRSLATLARGHLKDIHDVWLVSGAAWQNWKASGEIGNAKHVFVQFPCFKCQRGLALVTNATFSNYATTIQLSPSWKCQTIQQKIGKLRISANGFRMLVTCQVPHL